MNKSILFSLFLFFAVNSIIAQPGTLDTSFDTGSGFNGSVIKTLIQEDGKIIVAGKFTTFNGTSRNRIARLNTDGTLDTSFDPGDAFGSKLHTTVLSISIQADGKIIAGGDFEFYNGISRNNIVRLNADGTLDTSFDPGKGFNAYVESISIQTDGKIIVGGYFGLFNGVKTNHIACLNSDGSLDTTFGKGKGFNFNSHVLTTAIQSDGKIIVGGEFLSYNGIKRMRIARLNNDGTLDTSFDSGKEFKVSVKSIAIDQDGKIIVGALSGKVARLNQDGTFDHALYDGYIIHSISIQEDGKIIILGIAVFNGRSRNFVVRLNSDDTIDTTFDIGKGFQHDGVFEIAILNSISIQADGKIIVGGFFTSYFGTTTSFIARFNG